MDADSLNDDASHLRRASLSHHTLHRRGFSTIREEDSRYFRSTQSLLDRRSGSGGGEVAANAEATGATALQGSAPAQSRATAQKSATASSAAMQAVAEMGSMGSDGLSSVQPSNAAEQAGAAEAPEPAVGQSVLVAASERGHYAENPLYTV